MGLFNRLMKKGKENKQTETIDQENIKIEYYEDITFKFKDANVNVRMKPISLENFAKYNKYRSAPEELVYMIIQNCLINKQDNNQFTLEQVKQLFKFDLATALALKCLEVSNIPIDKYRTKNNEDSEETIKKVEENNEQKDDDKPFDEEIIKRSLSDMKEAQKNILNPYKNQPKRLDIDKVNSETTKWRLFLNKNNSLAYESLKEGNIEKAISLFEENVNAWDTEGTPYANLVRLYCFNEDYDNEIRICDSAIENLFGDNKIKDYIIRKEDAINRKNNKVKLNIDEELYNLILKEKRFFLSSSLDHEYYQTNAYKEEQNFIKAAKKEYLEKHPTNFLLLGADGASWFSCYTDIEDMKSLRILNGKGKFFEEQEEYEQAILIYQEAYDLEKKIFPNANRNQIENRIKVCNNKIKKRKIKELEVKAKELEKIDPAQAIGLYDELNILNPNLKKYNKRIEILNKKIN